MITYGALISACEKGKQPKRAWEVLQAMQQQGASPSMITDSALISACEKGKQPERAWEIFQAMQQQGLMPSVITYNALISACEKGKQSEHAWEVFQAMQQQGFTPSMITYSAAVLVQACLGLGAIATSRPSRLWYIIVVLVVLGAAINISTKYSCEIAEWISGTKL